MSFFVIKFSNFNFFTRLRTKKIKIDLNRFKSESDSVVFLNDQFIAK